MRKDLNFPQGIGVDVVSVSRMEDFWREHQRSLDKILSPRERSSVEEAKHPPRLLAYFFSAKEAVFKSLDLEWLGIEGFRMIEIDLPQDEEKLAQARLSGKMKEKVKDRLGAWWISFLEVNDFVIAQAVSL